MVKELVAGEEYPGSITFTVGLSYQQLNYCIENENCLVGDQLSTQRWYMKEKTIL